MQTFADKETQRQLDNLEKRITAEYKKAWQELDKETSAYFANHRARWEKEKKAYDDGLYTKQQWIDWQASQIGRGERYMELRDDMAKRITQANMTASAYINDKTPSIFALNHNFSAYQIEEQTGTAFNIYNERTVKQMMMGENHTEFRTNRVNPKRDYLWNKRKIDSALIGGIIQGKPIGKIADSFYDVMRANRASAIRNARTSFTSAQNAGRQEAYAQAEELGIDIQKEWIATKDERTRDSHAELDGVRVGIDELFPNGLEYPADASGAPEEVYNCRCTMRAILPKYANAHAHVTGHTKETYEEWLENKEALKEYKNDGIFEAEKKV